MTGFVIVCVFLAAWESLAVQGTVESISPGTVDFLALVAFLSLALDLLRSRK